MEIHFIFTFCARNWTPSFKHAAHRLSQQTLALENFTGLLVGPMAFAVHGLLVIPGSLSTAGCDLSHPWSSTHHSSVLHTQSTDL